MKIIDGSRKYYCCDDCGLINPPLFMVTDELWTLVAKKKDFLCYSCFEERLGRHISIYDLKQCRLTDEMWLGINIYLRTIGADNDNSKTGKTDKENSQGGKAGTGRSG